jgi:NAD(P)-dependent dehydrogenase (short-subunit alcohol dehydrogenase family)
VSSGIGLALARRLLDAGWQVLGLDRQPPPPLPAGLRFHRCDLSDWQAADDAAFESLLAEGGGVHAGVHAFVHCAGIVRSGGAFDTDVDDAALLYRLHVEAAIRLMGGLKQHLADEGRVVLVASRGVLGRANRVPYAASKAAQLGLARSWAAELVRRRITVNVVAPGATDTPQLVDPARGAPPQVDLPIGRLINADEVAGTIAFLLGPDAGAITGQTLFVCGGASLGIAHV